MSDVRFAVRSLRRTPLFTFAAVASLTCGIGASAVAFSFVDAAMLRPPPFTDAKRLALLNITQQTPAEGEVLLRWSWPQYRLLARGARSFEAIASTSNAVATITGEQEPEPLPLEIVSSNYLDVMGVPLALGRLVLEHEEGRGSDADVIVLGYGLWQRRFGGAPDVLGRVVDINGVGLTVVGVAGQSFHGLSGVAQGWIPAAVAPRVTFTDYLTTQQNFITVVGRLGRGVTLAQARTELRALGERIHDEQPSEADSPADRFAATAMTLNEARTDAVTRRALLLLSGAVVVLLLAACANVGSLLLGRAASRKREIGVRLAIGASRAAVVRQLLLEGAVLASLAGAAGVGVAALGVSLLRIPPTLARGRNFYGSIGEFATPQLDWRVVAFTVAAAAGTVFLFGLLPALRATRTNLVVDLKPGSAPPSAKRHGLDLRELAVALQVALAVILVVCCGLLLTSYARLRSTDIGFRSENVLTFMLRPSDVRYSPATAPALYDRVLEELTRVSGVTGATVDGCAPLSMQCARAELRIVGRADSPEAEGPSVLRHYVAPSHFDVLDVPLIRGRSLSAGDRSGRPGVVVINQAAADLFWPGEDPLGQRVWFEGAAAFNSPDASAEIVGIVANVAYQPLEDEPFQPGFFTSYAQFTYPSRMVIVRTIADPLPLVGHLAAAVRRADPDLALFDVQAMESRARVSSAKLAFQTALFLIIGCIALSLSATGVYAVTAGFVATNAREIGIRVAIGADALSVIQHSLGRTLRIGLLGGVLGLLSTLAVTRIIRSTLYDTAPLDTSALLGAMGVLAVAFIAASYIPVRRALRLNPGEILRNQ